MAAQPLGRGPVIVASPAGSLVVLIGASGAGKTTFAARHFAPTEVLSSDAMRAIVADDANDQGASAAAFELLRTALRLRLAAGRRTVVDATSVESWARAELLAIARRHGRPALAIALALPVDVCLARNEARTDRRLPPRAIRRQHRLMADSLPHLAGEGFDEVVVLSTPDEVAAIEIERP